MSIYRSRSLHVKHMDSEWESQILISTTFNCTVGLILDIQQAACTSIQLGCDYLRKAVVDRLLKLQYLG